MTKRSLNKISIEDFRHIPTETLKITKMGLSSFEKPNFLCVVIAYSNWYLHKPGYSYL